MLLQVTPETAGGTAGEHPDRQEKSRPAGNPSIAAGRQPAAGDDAMQVRMKLKVLSPGVQDGEEADLRTQVFGIGRDGSSGSRLWPGRECCRPPRLFW